LIAVTKTIALSEDEIDERFIRSSGPGGQNVNKVATAVQLRFAIDASPALDEAVRQRLKALAGRRVTRAGVLVITCDSYRTQERNRGAALARLVDMIRRASVAPKPRRPTRPSAAARERRLAEKRARSGVKRRRAASGEERE